MVYIYIYIDIYHVDTVGRFGESIKLNHSNHYTCNHCFLAGPTHSLNFSSLYLDCVDL